MKMNADFTRRAVVRPEDGAWIASPSAGVDRWMLDRLGDEVARATSIVRYAPNSTFPQHGHGGGEEFLVLDGVFSDESGDYGPGAYVRNPVGTAHAPRTVPGATILVKLWQFQPGDDRQIRLDTRAGRFLATDHPGVGRQTLHVFGTERVALLRFEAGATVPAHDHPGGEEIYVIEGDLADEHGTYPAGTWLRHPDGSRHGHRSATGCLFYVKSGHLVRGAAELLAPDAR